MSDPQTSLRPDRISGEPQPIDRCEGCATGLDRDEARTVLRRHEWSLLVNLTPTCMECHAPMSRGHFPGCAWAAALDDGR